MKPDKQRMGRNGKFPVLTSTSWEESIRMARTEPNLVLEAIKKEIEKQKQK